MSLSLKGESMINQQEEKNTTEDVFVERDDEESYEESESDISAYEESEMQTESTGEEQMDGQMEIVPNESSTPTPSVSSNTNVITDQTSSNSSNAVQLPCSEMPTRGKEKTQDEKDEDYVP